MSIYGCGCFGCTSLCRCWAPSEPAWAVLLLPLPPPSNEHNRSLVLANLVTPACRPCSRPPAHPSWISRPPGAALEHCRPHLRRLGGAPSPRRRLVPCSAVRGRRERAPGTRSALAAHRAALPSSAVLACPQRGAPRLDGAQTGTHPPSLGWHGSGRRPGAPPPFSQQQHPGAQPLYAPQQQQQLPSSPQQQQRPRAPRCRRLAGQRRRGGPQSRQHMAGGRRGRRCSGFPLRARRSAAGLQRRRLVALRGPRPAGRR